MVVHFKDIFNIYNHKLDSMSNAVRAFSWAFPVFAMVTRGFPGISSWITFYDVLEYKPVFQVFSMHGFLRTFFYILLGYQ